MHGTHQQVFMPDGIISGTGTWCVHGRGKWSMDRIIAATLGVFIIILAPFAGILGYNAYTEGAYRNSFNGTYTFRYTLTSDGPLTNVTLFLPVPDDRTGNSPMVTYLGTGRITGLPDAWNATLLGTGKATLLKVTTLTVSQPEGIAPSRPFTVSFSMELSQKTPIETRDPAGGGVIFRPIQDLREQPCPASDPAGARCFSYTTSVYADYDAAQNTTVIFSSTLIGKNSWKIFEPRSNEYRTEIRLVLKGPNHGWAAAEGTLSAGAGSYEPPFGS